MEHKKQKKLFLRSSVYSLSIILISLVWYFGNMPLISNYLHDTENKTYDLLFITRHNLKLNPNPPKDILIVGIDATSINKVGVPWPWPRQFHAAIVDALTKAKTKLIIFDIIFDTISPLSLQTQDILGEQTIAKTSFDAGKEDDQIFAKSITKAMNVILACEGEPLSKLKYQVVVPIPPFLKALNNDTSYLGNSSVTYDPDNFVRRAKIIFPEFYSDPPISSAIAFRTIQKYLNKRGEISSKEEIYLGKTKIPKEFLINFYGPAETINTIPYWKTLELTSGENSENNIFKNKIVLIGRTKLKASIDPFKSIRSPDSFPTPFSALTPNFSGVEIQATILGNLLDKTFLVKIHPFLFGLVIFTSGLIANFIIAAFRQRLVLCFSLCLLLSIFYMSVCFILFVFYNFVIPPTFPAYGAILPIYFVNFLDQYFIVDHERRKQAKIFRQLVPIQIADEIEKMDQEQLALGGTKRIITVLFTDIQNFTGFCERIAPEIVVNILNQFFTEMVKIIHKHNGLVDKFIGDAIMALWGSPKVIDSKTQATLAAQCGLEMKEELNKLNTLWKRSGLDESLSIRVGINTDEAITGNVGSPQRIQFSAIGDGVNVASRLEAINKVYGTTIIVSENTAKLLTAEFHLREIDSVTVPGKDIPINIFELIQEEEYISELLNKYNEALKNYRSKDLNRAIILWEECLKIKPSDKPSLIMLNRSRKLNQIQLPEGWKPIWNIENK